MNAVWVMAPAFRACRGTVDMGKDLVMGQTSITSDQLHSGVLGKLTRDSAFAGLDRLNPEAIKASLLMTLDPMLLTETKIAGLSIDTNMHKCELILVGNIVNTKKNK